MGALRLRAPALRRPISFRGVNLIHETLLFFTAIARIHRRTWRTQPWLDPSLGAPAALRCRQRRHAVVGCIGVLSDCEPAVENDVTGRRKRIWINEQRQV